MFSCRHHIAKGQRSLFTATISWAAISNSSAFAQSPASAQNFWPALRKADARVTASQISWERTYVQQAEPISDIEKLVANAEGQWRKQQVDKAGIEKLAGIHRRIFQRNRSGWQQTTKLGFLHQGAATRGEITSGGFVSIGATPPPLPSVVDSIEFYDGRDAVNVEREAPQPQPATEQPIWTGNLRRGSRVEMSCPR